MEAWARLAMQRQPNVPALFGWLSLDRQGRWLIRGEPISRPQIIDTINANYQADTLGRWFFQNGPQRGYVSLECAPFVLHVSDGHLMTHTGRPVERPGAVFLDEAGSIFLSTEHGAAVLIDSDLDWALSRLRVGQKTVDETALSAALALPSGQKTDLLLGIDGHELPVNRLDRSRIPEILGFERDPQPEPGQAVSTRITD